MARMLGCIAAAAAGAGLARAGLSVATSGAVSARGADLWRTNYRGRTVSLAGGPALAAGASAGCAVGALLQRNPRLAAAGLIAGLGAGAIGRYDDVAGARPDRPQPRGFAGHFGALRRGTVTSGLVKIVGVGAAGLLAAAVMPRRGRGRLARTAEVTLGAGVIAGTANLVNLLDLRPGRALKVGIAAGTSLALLAGGSAGPAVAGTVGAAAALIPDDLDEEIMLGDCGANALGALLGVGLTERTGIAGRLVLLAGITALTAASEKVSFTGVIERTPVLRELDQLGRRR